VSDETYQAHRGDGLFQREENSARRFLIIHVAKQPRHVTAFHADAFDYTMILRRSSLDS